MRQAERRALTTTRLLDAAEEVFGRVGFHAATLDEIASTAGCTKGAVYSNFAGKDALFLALLDRHLDEQLAAVERLSGAESNRALRDDLEAASTKEMAHGSFGLLMLEFWVYAARDERARTALVARSRHLRERLAEMIAERRGEGAEATSQSIRDAALLVLALDAGLFLQFLIDPEAITPERRAQLISDVISGEASK
jgi:AcrR family transcriptional regulator